MQVSPPVVAVPAPATATATMGAPMMAEGFVCRRGSPTTGAPGVPEPPPPGIAVGNEFRKVFR